MSCTLAHSLNNLALLYKSIGEYTRAERLHVQARDIRKRVLGEEHPNFAHSLNNLALLYQSIGEYTRAEPMYVQARDILHRVLGAEHPRNAQTLNNLAGLYHSMGEYARAEPLHLEAQRVLSAAASRAVPSLSEAQARSWMDENRPCTDVVLAVLRRQQKWDSSEAYTAVWGTKGMVRRLQVGQSLSSAASPAASETFAQLRDARLKLAKLVSATPTLEQAEGYRQALATASERKEALEKRLAELNTATARELTVRDAKVDDLLQQLPDGVAVVDFVKLDDWEYVEKKITFKNKDGDSETRTAKEEEARPVYDAFVLRANRSAQANPAKWVPLGAAEPIETAIAAWRTEFAPVDADKRPASKEPVTDPEQKLRKLIWDKLEPHLDGIHTVVVIPDGALNRLPWAALPGRNEGEFLLHDYALTTAATGQQLYGVLSDPLIETKPELLVVGGIEYDKRPQSPSTESQPSLLAMNSRSLMRSENDFGWSKLPGTQVEAKAIAALWGDRGPLNELGSIQADEHSLARLLPQSRFAHLATHGFFDTRGEVYGKNLREQSLFESSTGGSQKQSSVAFRNPLLMTGIVMAGANVPPEKDDYGLPVGDDGILTAEEISGLDLRNTELVTLSACETGLGDITAGEGVYGLTRVLHKSGVRSVLASQWKVSDLATQELMRRFYENLWIKKQSKLEALRNAQLWMLEHPQELQAMGIQDATTRGKPRVLKEPTENQPSTAAGRTTPYFWAAFQLSGDWR
jgi:CHAT domain-containing protein